MEGGPPCFPPDFSCPMVLWILISHFRFRVRDSHPLRFTFPRDSTSFHLIISVLNPVGIATYGLACFPFARRYLGNRCYFLFLRLLRCFSSAGFPPYDYEFTIRWLRMNVAGFPHSEICGSKDICSYPQLIAACRVLLRLLMPRHSPCALSSLTFSIESTAFAVFLLELWFNFEMNLNYMSHKFLL